MVWIESRALTRRGNTKGIAYMPTGNVWRLEWCAMWCNGGWRERLRGDVPFEFICEIARARALAEAGHVEGGAAAARHVDGGGVGEGGVVAVGDGCGGRGGRWWWSRESGMADGRIKTEVDGRKELLARCKRSEPPRQEPRQLKSRAGIPKYLPVSASRASG